MPAGLISRGAAPVQHEHIVVLLPYRHSVEQRERLFNQIRGRRDFPALLGGDGRGLGDVWRRRDGLRLRLLYQLPDALWPCHDFGDGRGLDVGLDVGGLCGGLGGVGIGQQRTFGGSRARIRSTTMVFRARLRSRRGLGFKSKAHQIIPC